MEKEVLVTRNIGCKNLSKDEFVKMMLVDMSQAKKNYDDAHYHEALERHNKYITEKLERDKLKAIEYAYKKWKTEKKRNEYVNKMMVESENKSENIKFHYNTVTFFDFDFNPGDNGISGNCVVNIEKDVATTTRALECCFNEIKDNKYFKEAFGWKLINSSRPYVELILPTEFEKMFHDEKKALVESIIKFYENTYYFGD